MIKSILSIGILSFSLNTLQAQFGKYEKISDDKTESIEIFENKTFEYVCKTQWARSVSKGTWANDSNGQIILTSDYQLSKYTIKEQYLPDLGSDVKVLVGGSRKGQAPKVIKKVRIVSAADTLYCPADSDGLIAELDRRQALQVSGSPQQMDSLRQTEARRHYRAEKTKGNINYVEVITDLYKIAFHPSDERANCFTVTTQWAEDSTYRYFTNEPFLLDKKQLKEVKTGDLYKPAKK